MAAGGAAGAAATRAAKALLEAAEAGLAKLGESAGVHAADAGELACAQCGSLLYEPTTLEDGITVCKPCVRKYREAHPAAPHQLLPVGGAEAIGFGESVSVVLTELTQRCMPSAHMAAAARQRANAFFGKGDYAEAEAAYSEAISGSSRPDVVLHCNRALARVKLEKAAGALEDAERAVALCVAAAPGGGPGCPMWSRAYLRLGQALLAAGGSREGPAAFALAMSAAGTAGRPLLPLLVETSAAILQAAGAEGAIDEVRYWLLDGRCPALGAVAASEEEPVSLQLNLAAPDGNAESGHSEWVSQQLECALCLGLLFQPATVPCGHTLCRPCLARSLDHAFEARPSCPMCRRDLAPYLSWLNTRAVVAAKATGGLVGGHGSAQIPVSRALEQILQRHFQAETEKRREQIAREEAAAGDGTGMRDNVTVPIFICMLAMPGVACNLHIFEPRYRLMIRRCLESGQRQFGMCVAPDVKYGTMLHVTHFEQLPDGRSRVQTMGTRRFEVLEWGEKDGYATGRINWIDDEEEAADEGLQEPSQTVKRLNSLAEAITSSALRQDLEQEFGPLPPSDARGGRHCPAYVFWCASIASKGLGFPQERLFRLCYGDEYRHSQAKRAENVLEFYLKNFAPLLGKCSDASGSGRCNCKTLYPNGGGCYQPPSPPA